jgi:hypothetical protein
MVTDCPPEEGPSLGETVEICGRVPPDALPTYKSRLGDAVPESPIKPVVEESANAVTTVAGLALGLLERKTAAAPATCGDAIEVPDIVVEQVSHDIEADRMSDPGAKRSRRDP